MSNQTDKYQLLTKHTKQNIIQLKNGIKAEVSEMNTLQVTGKLVHFPVQNGHQIKQPPVETPKPSPDQKQFSYVQIKVRYLEPFICNNNYFRSNHRNRFMI